MSLSDDELFDACSDDDELLLQLAVHHESQATSLTTAAAVDAVPGHTDALISETQRQNEQDFNSTLRDDAPSPPEDLVSSANVSFAVEYPDREFNP